MSRHLIRIEPQTPRQQRALDKFATFPEESKANVMSGLGKLINDVIEDESLECGPNEMAKLFAEALELIVFDGGEEEEEPTQNTLKSLRAKVVQ